MMSNGAPGMFPDMTWLPARVKGMTGFYGIARKTAGIYLSPNGDGHYADLADLMQTSADFHYMEEDSVIHS